MVPVSLNPNNFLWLVCHPICHTKSRRVVSRLDNRWHFLVYRDFFFLLRHKNMLTNQRTFLKKLSHSALLAVTSHQWFPLMKDSNVKWLIFCIRNFQMHFHVHAYCTCIFIQISLRFIPRDPAVNEAVLLQVMVWHPSGAMPLPEQIAGLPTPRRQFRRDSPYGTVIWKHFSCDF